MQRVYKSFATFWRPYCLAQLLLHREATVTVIGGLIMKYPNELKVIVFQEASEKYSIWVAQCLDFDITAHGETPDSALYEFERLYYGQIQAALDAKIPSLKSIPKAPDFFWKLYEKANLQVKPVDRDFRFKLQKRPESKKPTARPVTRRSTRLFLATVAA